MNRTQIFNNNIITRRNGMKTGKLVLLVFIQEYMNFTIVYSAIAEEITIQLASTAEVLIQIL